MRLRLTFSLPFFILLLAGCNSGNQPAERPAPDNTYLDYTITGDEQGVVCRLQFRAGGPGGNAFSIAPGSVLLDEVELKPDSTKFSGVYYEASQPAEAFDGQHKIEWKGGDGKHYETAFPFQAFRFGDGLPDSLGRDSLLLRIEGLPAGSSNLRLVLADTAFDSKWVNEVVKVQDGQLTITPRMLRGLAAGPVGLELYMEEEQPLTATGRGGRLAITYALKREFVLRN